MSTIDNVLLWTEGVPFSHQGVWPDAVDFARAKPGERVVPKFARVRTPVKSYREPRNGTVHRSVPPHCRESPYSSKCRPSSSHACVTAPRRLFLVVYDHRILGIVAPRNDPLEECTGFDWDLANEGKNWERHQVTPEEAEEIFFNEPLIVRSDLRLSQREKRHYALGQTAGGRLLFAAFTVRSQLIRVVSIREMNRRSAKSMPITKKQMPEFQSEEEARKFWATHDSTPYVDWKSAQRTRLPNLKPSLRTISLRLPVAMIEDLKILANQRDVPYQSLLKVFLAERLQQERHRPAKTR